MCFQVIVSTQGRDIMQERDGWVDCAYLDLKKAFDKVPHTRLVKIEI